jgi:4-hydroxy-tetrahydrodipicolinate reductase
MKKINITVTGGLGRMGKIIIKKIINSNQFNLSSVTEKITNKTINKIKFKTNSISSIKDCDVIIDFSNPKATMEILDFAKKLKKKVIIGTTGFTKQQENKIKKISRSIAIFKSGNMSLGINILEYILEILSRKIPNYYQISVTDNHHKKKIDYPSGTALMLANAISRGKDKDLKSIKGKIFLNKKGNLSKNKINFFIKRKGKTIGQHSVQFNNVSENIELKHIAFSRDLFAEGALKAVLWIKNKNKGLYNMQDMLGLK